MENDPSNIIVFIASLSAIVINIIDKLSDKKTLHKIANILVFATLVRVRFARARSRTAKHIEGYKFSTPMPIKKVVTFKFMNGLDSYPDSLYHNVAKEIIVDCRNRDWAALVLDLSDCRPLQMPEKIVQMIKLIVNSFDSERIIIYEPIYGIRGKKRILHKNVVFVEHGSTLSETELSNIIDTKGHHIIGGNDGTAKSKNKGRT